MIAEEAYVLSKSFTKKSLDGQGALKGAPCTIKSITEVDGGQKITFEWTGTSGTKQTSEMTVKNGVSVTGISDKGNGVFTLLLSDGSESDPIQCVKGEDGFSPTATVEKVGKVATITITDKNGTTTATIKDGEGSEGGEANAIDSISVNGVNVVPDENKNVDITVPSIEGLTKDADLATVAKSGNYEDLSNKPAIPSVEGLAKTTDIPTKVSQLENDSNYLSSIPEEYVTETELSAKGYLTEHQDLSNYATKDEIPTVPSKVSELTNDSNYQTADDVTAALAPYAKSADVSTEIITEIAKVVADAPEDLNTLKEMSDWIAGHENDASAMNSAIQKNKTDISTLQTDKADASDLTAHTDNTDVHVTTDDKTAWNKVTDKVDKIEGKGLSTNDYTNEEKALVATIEDKVDKTSIVTALDDTVTDEQVASALLAKTELDKKIDKTSIVTELSDASTNDEVVGALTAYNELQKLESANKEQFATASGDYITVTDSVDGKLVELGVNGKSEQKQYTGKNLFDCNTMLSFGTNNGITVTNNGDGSYTLSGTATNISQMGKGLNHEQTLAFFNHGAGTYTISTQESPSVKASVFQCNLINYNGTDSDYSWQINMGYKTKSYNITQDMLDNKSFTIEFQYFIGKGVTINQTFFPQVEFGSEATEYEPYVGGVPSPNPSYPQAINSVGDDGSLVVKSCGKNLIPYPYYNGSDTRVGVTATVNLDSSITLKGTATSNYFFVLLHRNANGKGFAKKLRGKTVTISGGTSRPVLSFAVYDENGNNITPPNNEMVYDYGGGVTVTIPDNACDMYSYYYFSSGNTVDVTLRPQLEVSDVVTVYEPYKSSTTTIPLSEPLRAIGDIKDEITYQDGKWGVLRRTGKYVVDGTESWVLDSDHIVDCGISVRLGGYTNIFKGISSVTGNTKDMITDYLRCIEYETIPYYATSNSVQEDKGSGTYRTPGNIWISFGASDIEKMGITKDVDSVKAWLSSHNITFIYPLGTPTFEPFTDQTLPYLSTYDGVTNISNDDALFAEMMVKYPTTDASGVGSKNESRIAELAKDTDDKLDDVNESLGTLGKCKNLLNPTLQTTTHDGITCTNNGDGTYTLNGTCSVDSPKTTIILTYESMKIDEDVKFICCTQSGSSDTFRASVDYDDGTYSVDYGEGTLLSKGKTITKVSIIVSNGATVNNLVFKPMLTTNLSATYDDFVPYTGDGETLTHDVAEIKNDLGGLTFSASGTTLTITDGTNTWTLEANS